MKTLRNVLLIDDDAHICELLRINLEFDGLNLVCASTGAAGIEKAATAEIDLILLDMRLPDATGLEVVEQLKSHSTTAAIPVLMFSTSSQIPDMKKAAHAGAEGYLLKPFDPLSMAETLKSQYASIQSNKNGQPE